MGGGGGAYRDSCRQADFSYNTSRACDDYAEYCIVCINWPYSPQSSGTWIEITSMLSRWSINSLNMFASVSPQMSLLKRVFQQRPDSKVQLIVWNASLEQHMPSSSSSYSPLSLSPSSLMLPFLHGPWTPSQPATPPTANTRPRTPHYVWVSLDLVPFWCAPPEVGVQVECQGTRLTEH